MTSRVLNAIVLLGLVLSISCSESQFAQLEQIKNNEFANDFLGQQIVDTVLIQKQSGGTADVVIRLLNELITNLKQQQAKHDQEHTTKNLDWEKNLKSYRATVASLKTQISQLDANILTVEKNIRLSEHNIKVVQSQQRLVNKKQSDLRAARNVDKQAFLKRNGRQNEMLKAVNYIIGELQLALKGQAFVQLDNIRAQLAKLARENPLQALVQLTMTFNPKSVNYAIQKLNEIKVSLDNSIRDDIQGEERAVSQFTKLDNQFTSFLQQAAKEQKRLEGLLASQKAQLQQLKQRRADLIKQKKQYEELIRQTLASQKAYNLAYANAKAKRGAEQITINKVISIVQGAVPSTNSAESLSFTLKRK